MIKELKRKAFHLTGLVYVLLIFSIDRSHLIAGLCLFVSLIGALELLRVTNKQVNAFFLQYFSGLLREKERSHMSGVFWMALGVLCAVIVSPQKVLAMTAVSYLIFGDAAASVVGIGMGGPHWPGREKRISGTAACMLVCLVVGWIFLRTLYAPALIIFGALAATLLEFDIIPLNDNFTIPAGSAAVFALCSKIFLNA